MKAVLVQEDLQLEEIPRPELRDDTVLVRVIVTPITGFDIDVVERRTVFRGIPGSSFVGMVEEARGLDARELLGRRVVGRGTYGCGACDACAAGAEYRCPDRVRPGQLGAPGCHAEFLVLPSRAVVPVPDSISDEAASLLPLLAGLYSGISRVELPTWSNILIVGDGGMGLLAAMAFSAAGYTVTVRGKHGSRFDLLRRHNIHFNLVTDEAEVSGLRPGRFGPALVSYPFVVEASGKPSGWEAAISLASPGSTLFALSSCHDRIPRPLTRIQQKNIRLIGLREGPLEPAVAIVAAGLFDPAQAVGPRSVFDFENALSAYRRSRSAEHLIALLRFPR